MATNTENLNLKKPAQDDFYNVDDFNENFQKIDDFAGRKDNPHNVTKEQLGLGKVDNTSDADKPVSTAQAAAISDAKSTATTAQTNITNHMSNKSNPHTVTKEQIGLGNVPNVTTNDQTPTYTESSTLANLTSGEKLSAAFGKLKKAVTDLIAHVSKAATSSVAGHVKITDSKTSTATDTAASAKALKEVNDKVTTQGYSLIKTQLITIPTQTTTQETVATFHPITGVDFTNYDDIMLIFKGDVTMTDKSSVTSFNSARYAYVDIYVTGVETTRAIYNVTNAFRENQGTQKHSFNNIKCGLKRMLLTSSKNIHPSSTTEYETAYIMQYTSGLYGVTKDLSVTPWGVRFAISSPDYGLSGSANITVDVYGRKEI